MVVTNSVFVIGGVIKSTMSFAFGRGNLRPSVSNLARILARASVSWGLERLGLGFASWKSGGLS